MSTFHSALKCLRTIRSNTDDSSLVLLFRDRIRLTKKLGSWYKHRVFNLRCLHENNKLLLSCVLKHTHTQIVYLQADARLYRNCDRSSSNVVSSSCLYCFDVLCLIHLIGLGCKDNVCPFIYIHRCYCNFDQIP